MGWFSKRQKQPTIQQKAQYHIAPTAFETELFINLLKIAYQPGIAIWQSAYNGWLRGPFLRAYYKSKGPTYGIFELVHDLDQDVYKLEVYDQNKGTYLKAYEYDYRTSFVYGKLLFDILGKNSDVNKQETPNAGQPFITNQSFTKHQTDLLNVLYSYQQPKK